MSPLGGLSSVISSTVKESLSFKIAFGGKAPHFLVGTGINVVVVEVEVFGPAVAELGIGLGLV